MEDTPWHESGDSRSTRRALGSSGPGWSSLFCAQPPLGPGLLNPAGSELTLVLALGHEQRRGAFGVVCTGVCSDVRAQEHTCPLSTAEGVAIKS